MTFTAVKVVGRSLAMPLAIAVALLAVSTAKAAPGDLDPSFGVGGVVELPFPVEDVTVDSDGRTLAVGGRWSGWIVSRFLADGSPDPSFGEEGEVRTTFPGTEDATAWSLLVQPDGKILVGGDARGDDGGKFALARYLPDGSLDLSFAGGGRTLTSLGDAAGIDDLALQSDGRIVAAGARYSSEAEPSSGFAVARYLPDGMLDPAFGEGGTVSTDFHDLAPRETSFHESRASAVLIGPDDKIVVAGTAYWDREFDFDDVEEGSGSALARYLADGSLDPSFGRAGRVLTAQRVCCSSANDLVRQPDGNLVAAGALQEGADATSTLALARYASSGTLDPGFGDQGIARTEAARAAQGLALEPSGRLAAAGNAYTPRLGDDFAVARFTSSGAPDRSFGQDGIARKDLRGRDEVAQAIAVRGDGKLVLGGYVYTGALPFRGALLRYLVDPGPPDADADGILDGEDLCPQAFGPPPDGCPGPFARELTEPRFRKGRGRDQSFHGALRSVEHLGCQYGQEVRLWQRRADGDVLITTAQVRADELAITGSFASRDRAAFSAAYRMPRKGRYYFTAPPSVVGDVGRCAATESETLNLPRHERIITVRYRRRSSTLAGQIAARARRCVRGQRVVVTRKGNRVARARANARGRFRASVRGKGRVRATAPQNRHCASAESNRPRLR